MKTYNRRTIRLKGYDYTQSGAYFVTICTHERVCLFGEAVDGAMALSRAGEIAQARWFAIPHHHPNIELDAFVVMPNHVHGIVIIVGTGACPVHCPVHRSCPVHWCGQRGRCPYGVVGYGDRFIQIRGHTAHTRGSPTTRIAYLAIALLRSYHP